VSVERLAVAIDDGALPHASPSLAAPGPGDWRTIDRHVRQLAARRVALDAEEAEWLLAARRAEVHHHLGLGSFDEYLERILRYAPATARDRMRVVAELDHLPLLRAALMQGDLAFSAARELSRVATPATERAWLTSTVGQSVREIEQRVRGRKRGDGPDASPRHELAAPRRRLTLSADAYAVLLETRRHLERESGGEMTDADVIIAACRRVLADAAAGSMEATDDLSTRTPKAEPELATPPALSPAPATTPDVAEDATLALTRLGVSRRVATSAVSRTMRDAGRAVTVDDLVALALRRCAKRPDRLTGGGRSGEAATGGGRPIARPSRATGASSGTGRSVRPAFSRGAPARGPRSARAGRRQLATRAAEVRVRIPRARPRQEQRRRAGRARGRRRRSELRAPRVVPRRARG